MIICKDCELDVYLVQRKLKKDVKYIPYYCWKCENFKDYDEVTYTK